MIQGGLISAVAADSLGAELGLVPGDRLLTVNEQSVRDIIDLSFALADEYLELVIQKADGSQELYEIEKEYNEQLGIEFESAVFDKVRQCANRCVFCFVDQMPQGLRETLYIKDDDYRLSFLYGNFITLTNLTAADKKRIRQLHLSPLYISVHTTDGKLRSAMLNNKNAARIMDELRLLVNEGIEFHTQVVLCPGINDGKALEQTIADLYSLAPTTLSLAIVPVGLTRYRDGCYPLRTFSATEAGAVIDMVKEWQKKCRAETNSNFVYLADEFYLSAGRPIPNYEDYDEFPQLENGVGIVRHFIDEWENKLSPVPGYHKPMTLDVVCGVSAAKILEPLLSKLGIPNLTIRLAVVENKFFGSHVTVTGLLTGGDILNHLKLLGDERQGIIIPGIALRKGEAVFLDGLQPADIENACSVPVRTAYFAKDLLHLLKEWR